MRTLTDLVFVRNSVQGNTHTGDKHLEKFYCPFPPDPAGNLLKAALRSLEADETVNHQVTSTISLLSPSTLHSSLPNF